MLPEVEYFHVVFTLPEPIAALAYQNKKALYDILFRTSAEMRGLGTGNARNTSIACPAALACATRAAASCCNTATSSGR